MNIDELPLSSIQLIRIVIYFLAAWLVHQLGKRVAPRIARISAWQRKSRKPRPERRDTLTGLITGMIAVLA